MSWWPRPASSARLPPTREPSSRSRRYASRSAAVPCHSAATPSSHERDPAGEHPPSGNADMHAERGGGGRNERSDVYHRGEAGIAAPLGSIRTIDDSTHVTGTRHWLGVRSCRGVAPCHSLRYLTHQNLPRTPT